MVAEMERHIFKEKLIKWLQQGPTQMTLQFYYEIMNKLEGFIFLYHSSLKHTSSLHVNSFTLHGHLQC
jgi:hypothetical protein